MRKTPVEAPVTMARRSAAIAPLPSFRFELLMPRSRYIARG